MFAFPLVAYFAFASIGGVLRIAATIFGAYAGYFGPSIALDGRIEKRQTAIRRALPDTIDLLTLSVEAGLGFDAALRQVLENVPGELSEEISRTLREMQLGVSRADAFRNLKDRTNVEELRGFTLAIIQADAFGISIANVLRAQSSSMRLKRKQRTEEAAMKIPVKILFPVVFCVLPTLFIVVLGPGIIRMMDTFFS
jgi:tight adherence protein C